MNKSSSLVCYALFAGLSIGTVSAQSVTVKVTGHVTSWVDYTGQIGPYLPPSAPVTATYTYDTVEPMGENNQYNPPATQTSFVVNIGPFTFQTGSTSQFSVYVMPGVPNTQPGFLALAGANNPPLSNGVPDSSITFQFADPSGQWPTSPFPPAGAPPLTDFSWCAKHTPPRHRA